MNILIVSIRKSAVQDSYRPTNTDSIGTGFNDIDSILVGKKATRHFHAEIFTNQQNVTIEHLLLFFC